MRGEGSHIECAAQRVTCNFFAHTLPQSFGDRLREERRRASDPLGMCSKKALGRQIADLLRSGRSIALGEPHQPVSEPSPGSTVPARRPGYDPALPDLLYPCEHARSATVRQRQHAKLTAIDGKRYGHLPGIGNEFEDD